MKIVVALHENNMRLIALALVAAAPSIAISQAAPPPPPYREGTSEISYIGTTGNSATQSVGIASELILRPTIWETRLKAGYVQNRVDGITKAQALTGLARAQRKFFGNAAFFAQYTYLSDKFAGTSARHTADLGIAGPLLTAARHSLTADIGGGYATDKRTAGTGKSTAIVGAGAIYKWKISETSDFTLDGRYVGAVPDGGDWRYTNAASIAAEVSTMLSLKVSNTIRYVNRPVSGFRDTDVQTAIALVAKY